MTLNNVQRRWLIIAAVAGAMAVALGAIGAHALEPWLARQPGVTAEQAARRLENFKLGAHYQLLHALALLGSVPILSSRTAWPRWLWLAGILLFSGGLYGYGVTGATQFVHVVPVGGMSLIAGWIALAITGFFER